MMDDKFYVEPEAVIDGFVEDADVYDEVFVMGRHPDGKWYVAASHDSERIDKVLEEFMNGTLEMKDPNDALDYA